jgi:transposase InsO family protein
LPSHIRQLLTKPYSPTTTGKVERRHQTLQNELLNDGGLFATIEDAQAAVDAWREEYNHQRPHKALDMAAPLTSSAQQQIPETSRCELPPTSSRSLLRHLDPRMHGQHWTCELAGCCRG